MTQLIILRHGNTFEAHEQPRRIGTTDLPLTQEGSAQIHRAALSLKQHGLDADLILCSPLKRSQHSAEILAAYTQAEIIECDELSELNHGPDENQEETVVAARLGPVLRAWQEHGVLPSDWGETQEGMHLRWTRITHLCLESFTRHPKIVCVTSQGIARFAPVYFGHKNENNTSFRLNTGHYSTVRYDAPHWLIETWNTI